MEFQTSLFEIDRRVSFNELCTQHDISWYSVFDKIRLDSERKIMNFYKNEYDFSSPPLYLTVPMNGELEGKSDMRYMVVYFDDGDEVLVVYRLIHILGTHVIQVIDIPISIKGNLSHSEKVIKAIDSHGFATFIFKEKYRRFYPHAYSKSQYDDYWYDIDSRVSDYESDKKYSQHIGMYPFDSKQEGYCISENVENNEVMKSIIECRKIWWNGKGGEYGKDRRMNELKRSFQYLGNNLMTVSMSYKGCIMAFEMMIIVPELEYAVSVLYSHVSRNRNEIKKEYPEMKTGFLSNISKCINVCIFRALKKRGIKRLYIMGNAPGNDSLREYKSGSCDGKIKYFSTKR